MEPENHWVGIRKIVFHGAILRVYVRFRECTVCLGLPCSTESNCRLDPRARRVRRVPRFRRTIKARVWRQDRRQMDWAEFGLSEKLPEWAAKMGNSTRNQGLDSEDGESLVEFFQKTTWSAWSSTAGPRRLLLNGSNSFVSRSGKWRRRSLST